MKKIAIIAAAAVALSPVLAFACGEYDDSSASAQTASKLALAPSPQATKLPATPTKSVARTTTAAKPVVAKTKTAQPDNKVLAASGN